MAKNGFSMSNRVAVESVSTSITVTDEDCGKVFIFATASSAHTITLPVASAVGAGWNCTFIKGEDANKAHIITGSQESSPNLHLVGMGADVDGTSTDFPATDGTAASKITFHATTAKQGDQVYMVTDGENWYATLKSVKAAAASLS